MMDERISAVNRKRFRKQLAELLEKCEACGTPFLAKALCYAVKQSAAQHILCKQCAGKSRDLSLVVLELWNSIGGSPSELKKLVEHPQLQIGLERLIRAISEWGLKYPMVLPTTVKWEVTNRCNLMCRHCTVDGGKANGKELTIDEGKRLIDQCSSLGVRNLGILGGEPLVRRDVFELIDYAVSKGLSVSITSNGILIDKSTALLISKSGADHISISVDGIGPVHDTFRGVKGAYEKTLQGIKNLLERGVAVTTVTVVSKHNLYSLRDIIDTIAALGIRTFSVNELLPTGRGARLRHLCLSQNDYRYMSELLDREKDRRKNNISILWRGAGNGLGEPDTKRGSVILSRCGAALTELTIGADGTVRPCPFLGPTTENIRKSDLKDIWLYSGELSVYRDRHELSGSCGRCEHKYSCGGCRARAEAFSGRKNASDIRCGVC